MAYAVGPRAEAGLGLCKFKVGPRALEIIHLSAGYQAVGVDGLAHLGLGLGIPTDNVTDAGTRQGGATL